MSTKIPKHRDRDFLIHKLDRALDVTERRSLAERIGVAASLSTQARALYMELVGELTESCAAAVLEKRAKEERNFWKDGQRRDV